MTALEYMEKQLNKHKKNYEHQFKHSNATEKMLNDIQLKASHYEQAVKALKLMEERGV